MYVSPYNPPQRNNSLHQALMLQALQQQQAAQQQQASPAGQAVKAGAGIISAAGAKELGDALTSYFSGGDAASTAASSAEPISTAFLGGASNLDGTVTAPSSFTNLFGSSSSLASEPSTAVFGGASNLNGTVTAPETLFNSTVPTTEGTTISNFAGSATPYLGAAGTALGAYGMYKGIKGKNPIGAGLGGLGAGLGLNAMGLALGPVGWGAMIAAPVAGALINKMGDKNRWKGEQKSRDKLANSGVTGWREYAAAQPRLTKGRSFDSMQRKDLAPDFIGTDANGNWVNNKFNMSRNVADLRPEDIMGYSAFGEKYGNDWFGKFNHDQRKKIADAYLKAGAVSEGRGQIKLKQSQALDEQINSLLGNKPPVVTKPLPLTPTTPNPVVNKPANLNNSTLKPQVNNLIRRAR